VSTFENDYHSSLEFDACDIRNEESLPVSIFEDDYDRSMVAGRLSASFREGAGGYKGKYCQKTDCFGRTAHELSPHEFRKRDTGFPQYGTPDDANLFQEPDLKVGQRASLETRKTKNLRVVLPRDDAEDLIWKPESRCKIVASYGPFDLSWTQAHRRGGRL
jgi:hypothetical protein